MPGQSTKLGPAPARHGSAIYPGFYPTVPPGFGRIQRLEKGSQRTQRGGFRPTSGTYARLPANLLTAKGNLKQQISISNPLVTKIGGSVPSGNTLGFAYTATGTSITLYWDGTNGSKVLVITRSDGTRQTLPTSGSGLTVTGLTASTTYYFLPFWSTTNQCNIGWVPGTTGSPQIAFVVADTTDLTNVPVYIMEQTEQGNEPLSTGFMSAATTSGGSGSGGFGGGGGGGHACVMSGTDVETIGDLPYTLEVIPETEWVHIMVEDKRDLYCTYDHPLYHAVTGKVRADMVTVGDMLITDRGEQTVILSNFVKKKCSKYKVMMKTGHLYWANGFLSHNLKPV